MTFVPRLSYLFVFLFTATFLSAHAQSSFFQYNESGDVSSLDPAAANRTENIWVVNQIFNGLVQLDDNLEVKPCIAKSWKITEGGTVYTFHLRSDVYFHDDEMFPEGKGRNVTAQDFVLSFFRLMVMDEEQSAKYLFSNIAGDERSDNLGFSAPDDTTFVVYLQKPSSIFLKILTMQYCSVVPNEMVEYYGAGFKKHPVGTGPFKFKELQQGEKLVLVKNEHYFEKDKGEQLPYLDGITITFIKDKQAAFVDFEKGKADMLSGADMLDPYALIDAAGKLLQRYDKQFVLQNGPYLKTDYLGFLLDADSSIVKNSPLRMKEIRQAIAYAIDRNKIVKELRNNIGEPALQGFIPKGMPSFNNNLQGFSFNLEKSKELLAKAGYENGKNLPALTLFLTEQYADLGQMIKQQLRKADISVDLSINKAALQSDMIANAKVNFFRKSWIADYSDPINFFDCFYSKHFSPQGPNYSHFKNPAFDKLYEQALSETDAAKRLAYYNEMEKIIIDEAPVIPLFYDHVFRLVKNNVEGLPLNSMNLLNLKTVKKKP